MEVEEEVSIAEAESSREAEVAPALISVHPLEKYIAAAVGPDLRVFDLQGECSVALTDDSGGPSHSDAIRAVCFGAEGRLFTSAGDDKIVKIWETDSWRCIRTVFTEKRVSAVAISHDGRFVTHADKFGIVWIVELDKDVKSSASVDNKAVPILGHFCSIITSLEFSPDGRFIATADRDFKIRITTFPKQPLKGAHEIQSFCLGHKDFVSCLAFARAPDCVQGFLLSGSGDSTVRMWDFVSGCLLETCEVGAQARVVGSNRTEKEGNPAVTGICASSDGSIVAVVIQSFNGVMLLNCNFSARSLSVTKILSMEENYIPTSLGWSLSAERLWTIMGASYLPNLGSTPLACVKVVSDFRKSFSDSYEHDPIILKDSEQLSDLRKSFTDSCEHDPIILKDSEIPGGEKLLSTLQGSSDVTRDDAVLAATAAALRGAMSDLLIKKQYSVETRELRKRARNDRKRKC